MAGDSRQRALMKQLIWPLPVSGSLPSYVIAALPIFTHPGAPTIVQAYVPPNLRLLIPK